LFEQPKIRKVKTRNYRNTSFSNSKPEINQPIFPPKETQWLSILPMIPVKRGNTPKWWL
jgi:hypothetical protein